MSPIITRTHCCHVKTVCSHYFWEKVAGLCQEMVGLHLFVAYSDSGESVPLSMGRTKPAFRTAAAAGPGAESRHCAEPSGAARKRPKGGGAPGATGVKAGARRGAPQVPRLGQRARALTSK